MKNFLELISAVNALCVTFQTNQIGAMSLVVLVALGVTGLALYVAVRGHRG